MRLPRCQPEGNGSPGAVGDHAGFGAKAATRADRLTAFVEQAWPALARLGTAPNADRSSWSFHADPAEAVLGASFVQENAPERLDVKRELLGRLVGAIGADAILASSSSV